MAQKPWMSYQEVATHLLNEWAAEFGLGKVEGTQIVPGANGRKWEIDAKGIPENGGAFVIVECRRWKDKQSQEDLGGLAYRIHDTGASGGIIVTPAGLQAGAKSIAADENVISVLLDENCTTTDFILQFLNKLLVGLSDTVGSVDMTADMSITHFDKDGSVVSRESWG